MKKLFLITLFILYSSSFVIFSQEVNSERNYPEAPEYIIPKNHDPNFLKLNKMPTKSFYESKSDWQHIIDSTWGPGDPLPQKLLIFNTYAQKIHDQFDGFLSLNLNWDSLYLYYLDQINDSTSKGAFSAIISHFIYSLKDGHTRAADTEVVLSALNPGVPILLLGSRLTVEHFGAVTTVLPDSTTLVLRAVPNHPLNLEPGDIILGYEGVPWKDLVHELFNAGLPMLASIGGCKSAYIYHSLFGAGINWHLFSTIDILQYSTGDTVHLSVLPLLNLNVPPMQNNEQLPIPNIPFPNVLSNQCVTYGILDNTNIGYIYLAQEAPQATADAQFYQAVNALQNTDALIIDMRLNFGGWAVFDNAFNILFNDSFSTIADAYRCNTTTFQLCPIGNWNLFKIDGMPPGYYERPIGVLLGPTCISMGDVTAQRLRYHPMVRFFGTSSNASLGASTGIENISGWYLHYSISDMYHLSKPDEFLNRREFPIDFPVWLTRDGVANGQDDVVNRALEWINNLVYPHDIITDKTYYSSGQDTVHLSTIIENPNTHQLTARAYLKTVENVLIDSVDLTQQTLKLESEFWSAEFNLPSAEEFYNIAVTVFDATASDQFTVPNATRFTTAGPISIESFTVVEVNDSLIGLADFKLVNNGSVKTIENVKAKLKTTDTCVTNFTINNTGFGNIAAGDSKTVSAAFGFNISSCAETINFELDISSDGIVYWTDSLTVDILTDIEDELTNLPKKFALEQNYPNPFNPTTKIKFTIPTLPDRQAGSPLNPSPYQGEENRERFITLKIYDILGNEIATLVNEQKSTGSYEVEFNSTGLSSGVYFYKLNSGSLTQTKKMVLIK